MKKISYMAYYNSTNSSERRNAVLSSVNKMNYICEALENNGYNTEIVSASGTTEKKFCKSKKVKLTDKTTLKLFSSLPRLNRIVSVIDRVILKTKLFLYMIKNTNKDSIVMVYHSLGYMSLVKRLKKLKGFKLIIEAEEIYGDVIGDEKTSQKEYEFFKIADGFIFPTELLSEKVNTEKKPEVIIYGTYHIEKELPKLFSDGKIHCVYAGTLDPRKGGAIASAESALFLNENYHIHILGFGNEKEKAEMLNTIDSISKKSKAKITYDGLLSGEEYIKFIQSCDIGLSTQNPNGKYNDTSFPSKILSYMANGLRVVSVRIPVVEESGIGKCVYYYDEQMPENIAKAIKTIDFSEEYDSRKTIGVLDKAFIYDLKKMLKGVE
uniref:glycosyltransferase n=1 Tax=Candidatus Fimenecus sp. TaxID=3022888 RepID=UPI003FEE614D